MPVATHFLPPPGPAHVSVGSASLPFNDTTDPPSLTVTNRPWPVDGAAPCATF